MATALLAGAVLLVLTATVFGVQLAYAGRIYPGVRGLGVDLGGQTRAEARATLEARVAELAGRAVEIGHEELRWRVLGYHVGIQPDVDRAVEEAYSLGRGGNLLARFLLTFGLLVNGQADEADLPLYDAARLGEFMTALAGAVERPVQDASLAILPDGTVEVAEGLPGRRLAPEATRDRLLGAFEGPEAGYVELAVESLPPRVTAADLEPVRARAEQLLGSPLVLAAEDAEWPLPVERLAAMVEVTPEREVRLKPDVVKTWVQGFAKDVDRQPQNARFTWSGGTLSLLRLSADGRELDVDRAVELVVTRAFDAERRIQLPIAVTKPDVSQDDGPKLGIKGLVESARTSYAGASPPKQHNIGLAAERLNGVVVPPGKLFSFNREVGSTSLDTGYKLGWGITSAGRNVKTVPAVAGGICQVATTLFHSVYWAGYQIEERNFHAYWIPSYTTRGIVGLDATVDEDYKLDFRFRNNTEHYLLIQSWTEGTSVVFGLYGTKPDWTVKVTPGERMEVVEANRDQVTEEEPTLPLGQRLAVEGAQDGFRIVNVRTVTRGDDVRTLRLGSFYRPSRNVVLVGTGGRPARPTQTAPNEPVRAAESAPASRTSGAAAPGQGAPAARATSVPTRAPAASTPAPARKPSGDGARTSTPAPRPPAASPRPS